MESKHHVPEVTITWFWGTEAKCKFFKEENRSWGNVIDASGFLGNRIK